MRAVQFALWCAVIAGISGVVARTDPQTPICHKCEENKKHPAQEIPRCTRNRQRPQPASGQCVVTYSCSGQCGSLAIPGLSNFQTLECDYAEVSVGPDGSIVSQCCDPPECPSCPRQLTCPALDGTIQRYGGKDFIYHCDSGFCATTTSSVCETATAKECAERCSKDPTCVMASHHGKTCTLATKVGSIEKVPGSVVLEPISKPDPPHPHGSDCAALDKTRQTIQGMEFLLHCDTRVTDPAHCGQAPAAASYEECAKKCATDLNCASASFSAGHCCLSNKKPTATKEKGTIGLEALPGYGCPHVDWAVKEIGGVRYEYHCDAWLESGGHWTQHPVANEVECALECSKNKQCTGISLRGQQCYLATAAISLKPKGDWVAMMPVGGHHPEPPKPEPPKPEPPKPEPPKPEPPKELTIPECREAHGREVTYKGHTYKVDCYRWVGGDGFTTATKSKLADCIKMCADHSNCVALHYLPSQQFCAIHDSIPRVGTQGDYGMAYVRRIS